MADQKPVRVHWELETPASRQATWALFSDTDRFNRAAELGYSYIDTPQPDGSLKRLGSLTRLGITVTWDEQPFHYASPDWFRSVRAFHGGPGERLVTTARFRDLPGGGTGIRYTVEVTPRSALYRPVVALELNTGTRRTLDRTFAAVLALLAGESADYDPTSPPLASAARDRVARVCSVLDPPELGERLQQLLAAGALRDLDRIRPLGLAREWGLAPQHVVDGCLTAARDGVLAVRWDVLCPSCRGPQKSQPQLSFRGQRIHCYACNIAFDGSFADALEVSFRPAPAIRDFTVEVACAGSPGRQRHVMAQAAVAPEGRETLELTLEAGPYRLSTLSVSSVDEGGGRRRALNPILIDVDDDAPETQALIHADSQGLMPARLLLRSGPVRITVVSECRAALGLKLELRWQAGDILTAGALMERPGAMDLIPSDTLDPAFSAQVVQQGVVAVEATREHQATVDAARIALAGLPRQALQQDQHRLVAVFSDPATLVSAALALASIPNTQVAVGWGSVVLARDGDDLAAWGTAVRHTLSVLPAAGAGAVVLNDASARAEPLAGALQDRDLLVVRVPQRLPGGRPVHLFKEG